MPLTLDDVFYALKNPIRSAVGTAGEIGRVLGNGRRMESSQVSVPAREVVREVVAPVVDVRMRAEELMRKKNLTEAEQLWLLNNGF